MFVTPVRFLAHQQRTYVKNRGATVEDQLNRDTCGRHETHEAHLWGAANILRGKTAGQDYKNGEMTLTFRLSEYLVALVVRRVG
jgi:hypothetical protein